MFKVIIVDDEKPIVQGFKVFIDWKDLGFEVVGEAYNGQIGVELSEKLMPHVIITDIRMPLLDGLAMIEKIKAFNPNCRFIILSGYSDFEYARDAVSKGATGYLLKPVKADELIKSLLSIKEELSKQDYKKKEEEKLKRQLKESLPALRERYLNEIVTNEALSKLEIMKRWDFLDTKFSLENFCVLIIEIDDLCCKYKDSLEDRFLVKFAVNNIIEELVDSVTAGIVFNYSHEKLIILCCQNGNRIIDEQLIINMSRRIQNSIEKYLKETVTIASGSIYKDVSSLSKSFNEAEKALEYKLLFGNNSFIKIKDIKFFTQSVHLPVNLEKKLMSAIELGQKEEAESLLDNIFQYLKSYPSCKPELLYRTCMNIMVQISSYMITHGEDCENLLEKDEFSLKSLFGISTSNVLKVHMVKIISDVIDQVNKSRSKKIDGVLGQVKEYIERNYQEILTLDSLSNKFYINSCYLSQLFKKKLGFNFIEFLTKVRMDNAKKLLLNPDLKVYEVANRVGYDNYRYFSKIFKKHCGDTPFEYRKKEIGS